MDKAIQIFTAKDILEGNFVSIEEIYKSREGKEKYASLKWGKYVDVLFSFVGIFALGIYIYDNNREEHFSIGKDNIIRIKDTKKWLYSRKYINEKYQEFEQIAKDLQPFAKVYNSIGNLFPIWYGGNEFKGKVGCYDIPNVFFCKDNYWKLEELYVKNILGIEIDKIYMEPVKSHEINDIREFMSYDKDKYLEFIEYIVKVISKREEIINSILK